MLHDLAAGIRYVTTGQPVFLLLTATAALYTLATSAFTTLFPVFGRKLLDLGPVEVGYLWSMLGVGLLLTSLALTTVSAWSVKRRAAMIVVSSVVSGAALMAIVPAKQPAATGLLLAVLGAGIGVLTPVAWGILQELTPPHLLGRALSFYTMGAMMAAMGGISFFGWMTGQFGEAPALLAIGVVMWSTAVTAGRLVARLPWESLRRVP
jgi:MFS family permease